METSTNAPRKRHVLIVDDDDRLAQFLKKLLELHGYEAEVATDGKLALKHVLEHHTDVVLCDLQMPTLEGDLFYATVERVKPAVARRFIFITGHADDPHFHTFVTTVDAPVLQKPVPMEKLVAVVEDVVQRA
jgi:DNA-binding NtrC family response regulator